MTPRERKIYRTGVYTAVAYTVHAGAFLGAGYLYVYFGIGHSWLLAVISVAAFSAGWWHWVHNGDYVRPENNSN